jgi:hypothetical protein
VGDVGARWQLAREARGVSDTLYVEVGGFAGYGSYVLERKATQPPDPPIVVVGPGPWVWGWMLMVHHESPRSSQEAASLLDIWFRFHGIGKPV